MKNLPIILSVILLFAVAHLYYITTQNKQDLTTVKAEVLPEPDTLDSDSLAMDTTLTEPTPSFRIAYVNSDSLLENYGYFKQIRKQMEAKTNRFENQMESRVSKLEGEYQETRTRAEKGRMTQDEMMQAEQSLMKKQQDIGEYREREGKKLLEEEAKLNKELNEKIRVFLKGYAKKHGYYYVFGYTGGGGLLYADEVNDVTADVLAGLNRDFEKKNK